VRNSAFDAPNYFDIEKAEFRRNQYGGSAGGPIKKNKTFIFGDYEELRENKGCLTRRTRSHPTRATASSA